MHIDVTFSRFCDEFNNYDRENQFSYDAKKALYEELIELENQAGEESELDVIALCCDWTEYADLEEFREAYGDEYKTIEDVQYQTSVIPIRWGQWDTDGPFLAADF